jgi:hypothetical protein
MTNNQNNNYYLDFVLSIFMMRAYLFLDFFLCGFFEFLIQSKKISIFRMSSVVDELPTLRCSTDILPAKSLLKTNIINNEDQHFFDQLTDRLEPASYLIYGNGRSLFHYRN